MEEIKEEDVKFVKTFLSKRWTGYIKIARKLPFDFDLDLFEKAIKILLKRGEIQKREAKGDCTYRDIDLYRLS